MESGSPKSTASARRPWVVLLYFYLAALIGLGFVVTGVTTALFGLKDVLVPQLGISSYSYEGSLRRDKDGTIVATEEERQAARQRAVDDKRLDGAESLIDGAILSVVGAPTLIWHLRRGRRVGAQTEHAETSPPAPPTA